jgi:hypothetical protein
MKRRRNEPSSIERAASGRKGAMPVVSQSSGVRKGELIGIKESGLAGCSCSRVSPTAKSKAADTAPGSGPGRRLSVRRERVRSPDLERHPPE